MPTVALSALCACARPPAPPAARRSTISMLAQRGFMLEVRCSGGKTYYQRYTDERGRERQYKIGPADVLSLEQARRKARQMVRRGAAWAPIRSRSGARCAAVPQLGQFVHERYLPHVRGPTRRAGRPTRRCCASTSCRSSARSRSTRSRPTAISDLINRMREDGYASGTMNRVIVILRYIYNLARKWKVPGVVDNPAAGLERGPGRAAQPLPHRAGG